MQLNSSTQPFHFAYFARPAKMTKLLALLLVALLFSSSVYADSENNNNDHNVYNFNYIDCTPKEACLSNVNNSVICADGYNGAYCEFCSEDYYRFNGRCLSCPSASLEAPGIMYFALFFLMFIFTVIVWLISTPTAHWLNSWSIAISGVQLISMFITIDVAWTGLIYQVFEVLNLANFNINLFALECGVKNVNYWTKWLIRLFMPFIFLFFLIILFFLTKLFRYKRWDIYWNSLFTAIQRRTTRIFTRTTINDSQPAQSDDNSTDINETNPNNTLLSRFIYSCIIFLTVLYTSLAQASSEPFNCKKQAANLYILRADPSVLCYSNTWNNYSAASIIFLALYTFGIPLFFGGILFYYKRQRLLSSDHFIYRYNVLTKAYIGRYFYWEAISLAERGLIILLINLNKADSAANSVYLRVNLAIFILSFYVVLQGLFSPYILSENNRLRVVWNLLTIYWLYSALVFDNLNNSNVLALELPQQNFKIQLFEGFLTSSLAVIGTISLVYCAFEHNYNVEMARIGTKTAEKLEELDERNESLINWLFPSTKGQIWPKIKRFAPKLRENFMLEVEKLAKFDEDSQEIAAPAANFIKPRSTVGNSSAASEIRRFIVAESKGNGQIVGNLGSIDAEMGPKGRNPFDSSSLGTGSQHYRGGQGSGNNNPFDSNSPQLYKVEVRGNDEEIVRSEDDSGDNRANSYYSAVQRGQSSINTPNSQSLDRAREAGATQVELQQRPEQAAQSTDGESRTNSKENDEKNDKNGAEP
jgi:hypothetical protein